MNTVYFKYRAFIIILCTLIFACKFDTPANIHKIPFVNIENKGMSKIMENVESLTLNFNVSNSEKTHQNNVKALYSKLDRRTNNNNNELFSNDKIYEHPVWIDAIENDKPVNIFETRKTFDAYWEKHKHFKGDLSKQFEEWYQRNISRLDSNGCVITKKQVNAEFKKYYEILNPIKYGDWYNYGPINVAPRNGQKQDGGRVKGVSFDPVQPSTLFASCYTSGFFKSTDSGKSWIPLTDSLIDQVHQSVIDPQNPDIIYISTDLGVKKSTDGGKSWVAVLEGVYTETLVMKKDNPSNIIVGCKDGIRLSKDSGKTFEIVSSAKEIEDLELHPTNPNIIYAASNTGEFHRSSDGGNTWTKNTNIPSGVNMKVSVSKNNPDLLYVIIAVDEANENSFGGVFRSLDAGITFEKRSGNGMEPCITCYSKGTLSRGQPNYNLFITPDPKNPDIVYAGGVQSWRSKDGGKTWEFFYDNTSENGSLHLDQLNWHFNPHNDVLYACNDGGIYYLNSDEKFVMITDGLPIAEVWEITQSKTVPNLVAGGTFHCGIKMNYNGQWLTPGGGDNAYILIDYQNPSYVYYAQYDRIYKSTDGGFSFPTRLDPIDGERGLFTSTGFLDNQDPNVLYMGRKQVSRITDVRTNHKFENISSFSGTENINKIEQCTANGNVAYVSRGNKFYRTENLKASVVEWKEVALPFAGIVNDIATHPSDDKIVYIIIGSAVYQSSDKGNIWSDIDPGKSLPAIGFLEMVYDNSSDEGIYIGTDFGVFYKDKTLDKWIDYSNGLPAIPIKGMDIYYHADRNKNILTIATDGRGIWRSPLYKVSTPKPKAGFVVDRQITIVGRPVKFSSDTVYHIHKYEWDFPGGIPEKSIDINPSVIYSQPGKYNASLKIKNSNGHDSITKKEYITVNEGGIGDLQLHLNFEKNLLDNSLYLRDASSIGAPAYETSKQGLGVAYKMETINTLNVQGYKGISGSNSRTLMSWINSTTPSGPIINYGTSGTGTRFTFRIDNGLLRVEIAGSSIIASTKINDGKWHHVAIVLKDQGLNTTLKDISFYVDGKLDIPSTIPTATAVNTGIGADVAVGSFAFGTPYNGLIDDIRIYSKAMTSEDINQIINSSLTNSNDDLNPDSTLKLTSSNGKIYIHLQENSKFINGNVKIYNLGGALIDTFLLDQSLKNSSRLVSGIYLVNIQKGRDSRTIKIFCNE
jgi:PKD repeat protein/photosystem II stability/assembly factor-like uncharacterized protein